MHYSVYNDPPPEQFHASTAVMLLGLTVVTVVVLYGIAYVSPSKSMRRALRALGRLRGWRAVAVCALFGFVVTMSIGLFVHMPQPRIHDEYSYLLAADTFAHGRLTNPTHPLWRHFETIHELMHPSYASKYPPGQGLMLALGEVLGNPAIGLWISAGLACAAVCWMLMAFYPTRWAMLGGLLTALHPMVLKWTQNYWGGLVAMIGGALVIGAARRLAGVGAACNAWTGRDAHPTIGRDAAVFAVGIAILLNSRPWEGGLLTLLVGGALLSILAGRGRLRSTLRLGVLPAATVLALSFAWMGYYNWRVTGHATRLPYVEHEAQYWVAPTLMFLPIRPIPPTLTQESMRGVAVTWAVRSYREQHTPRGFVDSCARKIVMNLRGAFLLFDMSADDLDPPMSLPVWLWGFRWLLLLPLAAAFWRVRRDPWLRWSIAGSALFGLLILTDTWMHPHYAAPTAGLIAVVLVGGLRSMWGWSSTACLSRATGMAPGRRPVGAGMVCLIGLCFVCSVAAACWQFRSPAWVAGNGSRREVMIDYLQKQGPRNLVIVRYGDGYQINGEWVYNAADIDDSPIVWARELDPASNARLLGYFHDRRPWLLLLDKTGAHLYPIQRALPR